MAKSFCFVFGISKITGISFQNSDVNTLLIHLVHTSDSSHDHNNNFFLILQRKEAELKGCGGEKDEENGWIIENY